MVTASLLQFSIKTIFTVNASQWLSKTQEWRLGVSGQQPPLLVLDHEFELILAHL